MRLPNLLYIVSPKNEYVRVKEGLPSAHVSPIVTLPVRARGGLDTAPPGSVIEPPNRSRILLDAWLIKAKSSLMFGSTPTDRISDVRRYIWPA